MNHTSTAKSLLIALSFFTTSCYTTRYTFSGNVHQQRIGQSKNNLLRDYGAPDRVTEDGAGGQILVYENFGQFTSTSASAASYGRSATSGAAIYGNGAVVAASQGSNAQYATGNSLSRTVQTKEYANFFVNNQNMVYDVKANTGDKFSTSRCFNPGKTWLATAASGLLIWPLIITVPVAAVCNIKAKKNGTICK